MTYYMHTTNGIHLYTLLKQPLLSFEAPIPVYTIHKTVIHKGTVIALYLLVDMASLFCHVCNHLC